MMRSLWDTWSHHIPQSFFRYVGFVGTVLTVGLYVTHPSWPTPDKIIILLIFIFMMFGQASQMLLRLGPFVALLLVYESFRSLVPNLNTRVEYMWMIRVDEVLGHGRLPTKILQSWLWHGSVKWYDFALYGVYMLHFILPIGVAILIWKLRSQAYWRYVITFIGVSFAGFITFLVFPAAPPWLASDKMLINPGIVHVSSQVWWHLGITDFPSFYNKLSPNPVAAVPSLHAAYATLLVLFVWQLFGRARGLLMAVYPTLIYFGTVYMGEHYVIDELIGSLYAIVLFIGVQYVLNKRRHGQKTEDTDTVPNQQKDIPEAD